MTPTDRTATNIKLRELQRQRDRLDEHYSAVERQVSAAGTPFEKLTVLYEGLRAATFAQKRLHPEVANLDGVLVQGRVGEAPTDLIDTWLTRLHRELTQGRLRGELAHAFGRILDEPAPDTEAALEGGLSDTVGTEPLDLTFLDRMIQSWDESLTKVREHMREMATTSRRAVTDEEVKAVLRTLSLDTTRSAEVQRRAATARNNPTQIHDYAGVLTIVLENLHEWDWPEEGMTRRTVLLRDRPRVFLNDDLVTALLWQLIGMRWGMELHQVMANTIAPYQGGPLSPPGDLYSSVPGLRLMKSNALFLPMIPRSPHEWVTTGGYGRNVLEDQLRLVQAEIRLHQARSPGVPLFVVQADVRDFYPSLRHDLVLGILERLGVPGDWIEIVRRFLSVPVRSEDGDRVVRQGVPLDYCFGDLLAELVMLVLEIHIYQETGIRLMRVVDDIFYVTENEETAAAVWEKLLSFMNGCGLSLNPTKLGTVVLGSETRAKASWMPEAPPRWGVLTLHSDGRWRLDEAAFGKVENWLGRYTRAGGSTLDMVRRYNDAVRFLVGCLGLTVDLGTEHLDAVGRRLWQLQQNVFGPGHGIAAEMRHRLGQHFRDVRLQQRGVPEALLYWPVTAGGLGLVQPLLMFAAYGKGRSVTDWTVPASKKGIGWAVDREIDQGAATYYTSLLTARKMLNPEPTPAFNNLVQDFIARGTEVAGQKQVNLRPYWQWALTTYGPALLEAVGTFRFLPTELVPLSLVMRHGIANEGEQSEGGSEDDIPF